MKKYRYYTLYRAPAPGAVPKGFVDFEAYSERTYIDEIGRAAWGYVEYTEPLNIDDITDYELFPTDAEIDNSCFEC